MYKKLLVWVIITLLFCIGANAQSYSLSVQVDGFSKDGVCIISIYQEGKPFGPNEKCLRTESVQIGDLKCAYTFPNLSKGNFAVIVFHDENNDGEIETNFIGIPKEGVGNSNNHHGRPSFKKSKISLDRDKLISITINYP